MIIFLTFPSPCISIFFLKSFLPSVFLTALTSLLHSFSISLSSSSPCFSTVSFLLPVSLNNYSPLINPFWSITHNSLPLTASPPAWPSLFLLFWWLIIVSFSFTFIPFPCRENISRGGRRWCWWWWFVSRVCLLSQQCVEIPRNSLSVCLFLSLPLIPPSSHFVSPPFPCPISHHHTHLLPSSTPCHQGKKYTGKLPFLSFFFFFGESWAGCLMG